MSLFTPPPYCTGSFPHTIPLHAAPLSQQPPSITRAHVTRQPLHIQPWGNLAGPPSNLPIYPWPLPFLPPYPQANALGMGLPTLSNRAVSVLHTESQRRRTLKSASSSHRSGAINASTKTNTSSENHRIDRIG
jgi:hypothetical protein